MIHSLNTYNFTHADSFADGSRYFDAIQRLPVHSSFLRRIIPRRWRLDMHGRDGWRKFGQILSHRIRQQTKNVRGSVKNFEAISLSTFKSFISDILGKIAVAVVKALHYLHSQLKVIHRDVKPSNILINRRGEVKMCDFGISGYLVDSVAKTIDAGCKPYMAPERIDPQGTGVSNYDIRSDVWSLGISLIEMATGKFPYATWRSPFEQLKQVVTENSPALPLGEFSPSFEQLINVCLQKDVNRRPNYEQLLANEFIVDHTAKETNVADYVEEILALKPQ